MRTAKRILAVVALVTLLQSAAPLHGQTPVGCPARGTIIIGHFNEGGAEVAEFCIYLVRHGIQPTFQNFGDIRTPGAAKAAAYALENEGTVLAIWIGTSTLARLVGDTDLKAKVLAVSDFTVFQVISGNSNAAMVDSNFVPTGIAVQDGRSSNFADTLFMAFDKPVPRCTGAPPVQCEVHPPAGDTMGITAGMYYTGALAEFLNREPAGAVILGSQPLDPGIRDPVKEVLAVAKHPNLVGIPPAAVLKMSRVHGMFAEVSIPKEHYAIGVPKGIVPAAADPRLLISATPPEVAERVRDFVKQVTNALLKVQPRVSPAHLKKSLELVRELGDSLGGRVVLHDEYVKQLQRAGPAPQGPIIIPIPIPLPGPPSTPPRPPSIPRDPTPPPVKQPPIG